MQSAFQGIEMGKRSLFAHARALSTVGHNLSNASTEGYSRQRVHFSATEPLYRPDLARAETPGQIGQGVDISRIERVHDQLLQGRIVANSAGEGYWQSRDKYIGQLEQVYNEPSELSLRSRMDKFWDSWQELSQYPEQMGARQAILERANSLGDGIKLRHQQLLQIGSVLDQDVKATVDRVNQLTTNIGLLNMDIVRVKAEGDSPNDLMDKRDLLVTELGSLVNITIDERDPDEYSIHTNGLHIVQGAIHRPFELQTDLENEGYSAVHWGDVKSRFYPDGGKLASLLHVRDIDLRQEVQGLDNMAVNFIDLVNEVHTQSYGLGGQNNVDFFVEHAFVTNANGNYDRNGDGQMDHSYVFRMTGSNALDAKSQIGLRGTLTLSGPQGDVAVDYFPTDTVEDLILRVNLSGAEVVARLDRNNQLSLKGAPSAALGQPDFVIRKVADSGQFLVGYSGLLTTSGDAGAYQFNRQDAVSSLRTGSDFAVAPVAHPSGWISVNQQLVKDPGAIAAALGPNGKPGEAGDGRAALEVAALRQRSVMVGSSPSFDDYFSDRVVAIGLKGQEAEISVKTHELIMKNLRDMRESYSGVNMDEELAQMIKFQHGYNAAARFITTVDGMLDVIINRMGV